jgi:tetratricopeptide (TPR) repeat protein
MMRTQIRVAIVGLAWMLVGGPGAAQDTVKLKDGTSKQGQVQEWDFRGAKLALSGGGGTTTIKGEEIASIEYGALPKEFKQAEDEFARGKDDEAVASYSSVIENKRNRSVFRQDSMMNQAVAYLRQGKIDEAVKALKDLLVEFPESRHLESVHARIVDVLVATGKGADAVAFIDSEELRLGKVAQSGPLLERVKLLKARAALGAGDTKAAKAAAQALAGGTSPIASEAKVLLAEIALAEKNVPEAQRLFTEAMKTVTSSRGRASAFNGLGMILLNDGKEKRKPDPIREALLLFLRTALVEIPDAGEPTDAHETGLYRAAECFQYLGELSAGGKEGTAPDEAQSRHLSRARELFRRLLREYPQSKHAADAQARLQKLGG